MSSYLMEHKDEDLRLEIKTDMEAVKRQARWAGIGPGMKVLDVGCGIGKTTAALAELVGTSGSVVGLDFSPERLRSARERYGRANITFMAHDLKQSFLWSEEFDAIWIRFLLEYFRNDALEILGNVAPSLRSGGLLVLADLDQNSLIHYGQSERLQRTLEDITFRLERDFNFDPYVGRRLPGYLQDLGYQDISVTLEAHHLIYGPVKQADAYNWLRKLEQTAEKSGCRFELYAGKEFANYSSSYEAFREDFKAFFTSPRRFTYTPLILAAGRKPQSGPDVQP